MMIKSIEHLLKSSFVECFFFNEANFIFSASPPLVTDIKLYNIEMHSFYISWDTLHSCQSTKQVTGYKIVYQRLSQNNNNVTITVERSARNYTVAGLKRNETYCIRILAYNENGDGHLSDCTEVTTATGNAIYF